MTPNPLTTPIYTDAKVFTVPGAESACFWEQVDFVTQGKSVPSNGGCVNDVALIGYPAATDERSGVITTFSGNIVLGRYLITSRYKQYNPFTRHHEEMFCYRVMTPDRRVFSGRNGGIGMVLKTRRSKTLTTKLRARFGLPAESC